jgi:hypothetical protein
MDNVTLIRFKVVGLRELVRPFTITMPNRKAESVLELPAHSIFRSRTKIGDQLLIERYEAKKPLTPGHLEKPDVETAVAVGQRPPLAIPPQTDRSVRFQYFDCVELG